MRYHIFALHFGYIFIKFTVNIIHRSFIFGEAVKPCARFLAVIIKPNDRKAPPPQRKRRFIQECDSIDKPSSVAYDHLSSPAVANGVKPPFNEARRADALSSAPIGVASGRVYTAAQSPALRWALTPPFHPYRQKRRRYLFCCTSPEVALG